MKIICIGRNYAEHIRELGNDKPAEPVLFLKPETALVTGNRSIQVPPFTNDLHHEAELVVQISREGKNIPMDEALNYIGGLALGIDFTARDLQARLKSASLPWEISKAFDDSAPVSPFIPFPGPHSSHDIQFSLRVNGELRQQGNTAQMIFPFAEIIHFASRFFRLLPGDMIFTGTPAGVSAVKPGDHLEGYIFEDKLLDFRMV